MTGIKPSLMAVVLVVMQVLAAALPFVARADEPPVFSVGVVPQFEARKLAGIWLPILRALEKETGFRFELEGSPNIPEFEARFQDGAFDLAYMNPYHLLVANRVQGYWPLVRDGGRELFGVLVVAKDSPVHSIGDLEGATISFPAPNALGASLLMRADLTGLHGLTYTPLYAQTHTSSYLNVLLGTAQAAGGVMGTFNSQKPEIRDGLRILYETRRMPPHPVAIHPRVAAEHRARIQKAFLDLAATKAGAALLAAVPFTKLVKADLADYRALYDLGL
ncbi:MAG: phosphate/phosphite/phosphonate ABC transporter substrate-binding protein, partial [Rhodospirillales bacterium]